MNLITNHYVNENHFDIGLFQNINKTLIHRPMLKLINEVICDT
ncbi:hypothetical protein STAWA0001_2228 [Staphylococcus warneri L37603]|nr:hypothetical protein STAWA0001_2228 [Staphylococcus warneri L37603]